MTVLLNSFEGGTNGTAITAGNSGGTSGNAFDVVTTGTGATTAFDSTRAAHGQLSAQIAVGGTSAPSFVAWTTSMGTLAQAWFRIYVFFSAVGGGAELMRFLNGSTTCGGLRLSGSGKLSMYNTAGTNIFSTVSAAPLGSWFRVEGFIIGSATTGQLELKLFKTADGVVPDETITSAATQNTANSLNAYRFGVAPNATNIGPYWIDDIGLSSVGYIGPAFTIAPHMTGVVKSRDPRRYSRAWTATVTGQSRAEASFSITGLDFVAARWVAGQPVSRWRNDQPAARWVAGQPVSRWRNATSLTSRWVTGRPRG